MILLTNTSAADDLMTVLLKSGIVGLGLKHGLEFSVLVLDRGYM